MFRLLVAAQHRTTSEAALDLAERAGPSRGAIQPAGPTGSLRPTSLLPNTATAFHAGQLRGRRRPDAPSRYRLRLEEAARVQHRAPRAAAVNQLLRQRRQASPRQPDCGRRVGGCRRRVVGAAAVRSFSTTSRAARFARRRRSVAGGRKRPSSPTAPPPGQLVRSQEVSQVRRTDVSGRVRLAPPREPVKGSAIGQGRRAGRGLPTRGSTAQQERTSTAGHNSSPTSKRGRYSRTASAAWRSIQAARFGASP